MKLQIRTLDRRTLSVNFSEFKTVGELKEHVCRLRGSWAHPEAQQLLYGGQVLDDEERLRTYCIDERKFILMLGKPSLKAKKSESEVHQPSSVGQKAALTKRVIMQLGPWTETEVCRALQISLNSPSRALSYLKKKENFFPKMVTPPTSELNITAASGDNTERKNWRIIDPDKFLEPVKSSEHLENINCLIKMGFLSDTAFEAYSTCDGNMEAAANLLLESSEP